MHANLVTAVRSLKWLSTYVMADGTEVVGTNVTSLSQLLRDEGWRRVPRIDSYDLRKAGFRVVRARYRSWGGLKKECDVVVLRDSQPLTNDAHALDEAKAPL
jgi:hypothetical protein